MPVKSIQVKLHIANSMEGAAMRRAAANTHIVHNDGVRWFMERLLELRQQDVYENRDSRAPTRLASGLQESLLRQVRQARLRNAAKDRLDEKEALRQLRGLYEQLVPASLGKSGDSAQDAKLIHLLINKEYKGGLGTYQTGERGRKPRWMKMPAGPEREAARQAYEARKEKNAPAQESRRWLKEKGILPLWPTFRSVSGRQWLGRWNPKKKNCDPWSETQVSLWEFGMFVHALARMGSWESWNAIAAKNQKEKAGKLEAWREQTAAAQKIWRPILDSYENDRTRRLTAAPLSLKEDFHINSRMLRGWDRIRERWLKQGAEVSAADLVAIAKQWQSKHPREAGDMDFILFLARPENRAAWSGGNDLVLHMLRDNLLARDSDEARPWTTMTLPDPSGHPLWTPFGNPSDENLYAFSIFPAEKSWKISLPLLFAEGSGLMEKWVELPVAPSGQMDFLSMPDYDKKDKQKRRAVEAADPGTGEIAKAQWGGASLRFSRDVLDGTKPDVFLTKPGAVYLSLAVDLPERELLPRKAFKHHAGLIKGLKEPTLLTQIENLGCLSIDLGMRQLGACSVFRLDSQTKDASFSIPIYGTDKVMLHERSFLLPLPGERPDAQVQQERRLRWKRLNALSAGLRALNALIRLAGCDAASREAALEDLSSQDLGGFAKSDLDALRQQLGEKLSDWQTRLAMLHRKWELQFARSLRDWRKETIRQPDHRSTQLGVWGLSLSGISYHESVRKLLIRWTNHPRRPTQIRRLRRGSRFAVRLQRHIDRIKEDRIKKSADLIVGAALGLQAKTAGKPSSPCHLILFEDLSRYRFRTDRPRQENGKLMQWSHRALLAETVRQAALHGIAVGDVGAGFSSRYHARTGMPGARCMAVSKDILSQTWFQETWRRERGKTTPLPQAGKFVRWSGGELFCCAGQNGKRLTLIQADINAAQNLQVRFWTDYAEPFRVAVSAGPEADQTLPVIGARNKRYFDGKSLKSLDGEDGPFVLADLKRKVAKNAGEDGDGPSDASDAMTEEDLERLQKRRALFRDPSGKVLPDDRWYPIEVFWSQVSQKVEKALSLT